MGRFGHVRGCPDRAVDESTGWSASRQPRSVRRFAR